MHKVYLNLKYYIFMNNFREYWFRLKDFMGMYGWDINGVSNLNLMRPAKFYKFKHDNFSIYSFVDWEDDDDEWADEVTVIVKILLPLYFFFASGCILFMFFFILDYQLMGVFYFLQLAFVLFVV